MAEQNISAKQADSGKSYNHIRRIKDFPNLILSLGVGHRREFFRTRVRNGDEECTLSLVLYPAGYDDDHSDYVAIRASLDQRVDCQIVVEISILSGQNEECFKRRLALVRENEHRVVVKNFVGKSALLNDAELLRDNDLLKIACRLSVNCEDSDEEAFDEARFASEQRNAHMDRYERLFENGEFSDFKLTVGDTTFSVHKCILATHSPVFAAMFRNDMSEKSQASGDIRDVDAETLRELLRFIYVARAERLDERASDLWIAADKYHVNALKDICEEKLIEKLSVRNIVETLCLLDRFHTMSKLKAAAIQCVIDNAELITSDDKFKDTIKKLSSDLLSDVLCVSLKKSTVDS